MPALDYPALAHHYRLPWQDPIDASENCFSAGGELHL